jgi:hypothetical protein
MIRFTWNGKEYEVKKTAPQKEHIVLPNRKLLRPIGWSFEHGLPPSLLKAEEVEHHLQHQSLGEIAEHYNGIMAHEVD